MPSFVRTQEVEHRIGSTGRFVLRVTAWDVELRQADADVARVRIEFDIRAADEAEADDILDRVRFGVHAGDGFLEVAEPRHAENGLASLVRMLGGGHDRAGARIVAEVPAEATVAYNGVSAQLLASGLVGPQEYRTVSGDIVLADAAGAIRIAGVSGDVSLRGVGPVALEVNTVSGDVSAFAPVIERARAVTVSGDIELEGELAESGEHRLETVSGDLSLGLVGGMTLEVRGLSTDVDVSLPHRSEGSRDRRRYVIGEGRPHVVFSSMSGDVSVSWARRFGPAPPAPPASPAPPAPPAPLASPASSIGEDEQLAILRELEAGEIDVDEAARRLAGEGPSHG